MTIGGLAGQAMGVGFKGALAYVVSSANPPATATVTETAVAVPPALTGTLAVDRLPLPVLAALAIGPPSAPKPGALWSDAAFAPGFLTLPRSEIALSVPILPLTLMATARDATMTLQFGPSLLGLSGLRAKLGDGHLGATLALRRNGAAASLGGHVDWDGVSSATPSLGGRTRGALDIAGTGNNLAGLVASLAGGGTLGIEEARLPRLDIAAIGKAVAAAGSATEIDNDAIKQTLTQDLDRGALDLGTVSTPVTLAAGVLRGDPLVVDGPAARSTTTAALDLRTLALSLTTTVTLRTPPKDWVGTPPTLTVTWKGPFAAPARDIDAATLVNGIAARAIARDQARIEAFQDDVRERAFFARRLRQIEAEQQEKAAAQQKEAMQKLLQSLPGGTARPAPAGGGAPAKTPLDLTPRAVAPAP
jgi:hypothetical protein